ncbi:MAG TPA: cation-translocating P-type ATPase, partial [Candidatus Dorea gallistercoris]|nr:cation-translocating P-type ATPase [Candidatus Dorea gallistercoris]
EDYYVDDQRIPVAEIDFDKGNQELLFRYSILCNDSTVTEEQEIGDPTETALVNVGNKCGRNVSQIRKDYPRLSEVPFDSDRKLMSTAHGFEGKYTVVVKGAVDVLLGRMSQVRNGDTVREITEEDRMKIEKQNMEFSRDGLRVLAFCYKEMETERELTLEDENDLTFLGLIAMMDPPREESKAAVAECISAGIKPIMITGDHKVTAAAIAKRIGILKDESEACEGAVIENMSDEELKDFVEGISVYARVSPEHKIRIVRAWQDKGNIVAMTGDGVNDAPALKQANIGVAMGITGSEVSKDAAAMVLTDDNFATIVKAVENGRNIYQNIKNSIQFLLSGNFGAILAVLYASIAALPVPFAPVHLLFINLLTDSLPAIALGLEPHTSEVMKEKPRPMNESILTKNYLLSIGTEGLVIGIMTMTAFMIGYRAGDATLASTMAFGTLCTSRLVHGFNCKSNHPVIFTKRFFNNIYLIGAFLLGLALITSVLMIPALRGIFKVAPLSMEQLFTIYGLALLNLPVIQLLKWIRTRIQK